MTTDEYQALVCASKATYLDKKKAKMKARKFHGQRPYRCPVCHRWHLTKVPLNRGKVVYDGMHRSAL